MYISNLVNKNIALIHRDIRWDNVGVINVSYVLFDFELSVWGDPIWDYARILFESKDSERKQIFKLSGYSHQELIINEVIFSLSFLHYLISIGDNNNKEISKCINKVSSLSII